MRKITADYIYPISSEPLKNGVIVINDEGIILDILPCLDMDISSEVEYYEGIICPGLSILIVI
jgi:hypothetical protein